MKVLEARSVSRTYPGPPPVEALRHLDLVAEEGEFVGIVGPSGAGKSTILNLIGLLDVPTSGELLHLGAPVATMSERNRSEVQRRVLGFVFQDAFLLKDRTVAENLELRLRISGAPRRERRNRIESALSDVGMLSKSSSLSGSLSGGEAQRVAIARALITSPRIILADEPTGNLDTVSSAGVVSLLRAACIRGCTVIVITHSHATSRAQLTGRSPSSTEWRRLEHTGASA